MTELRFDGRVAIITGGGRGMGREHALLLAGRGAAVVVNDLGCDVDGTGSSEEPATSVVEEIRSAGGTALADFGDVRDPDCGQQLVTETMDRYGRLDIVINNAGIFRPSSFADMKFDELVHHTECHLYGTATVCSAAWPHLRQSPGGRIVNTVSAAGIYGAPDTAAYSAAKAGIFGLTRTLALEGAPDGVHANCIAPVAWTRMAIAAGAGASLSEDAWKFAEAATPPAANAAIVAFLAHESCALNGEVLTYSGQRVARFVLAETAGIMTKSPLTPESVASELNNIMNLDGQLVHQSAADQIAYTQDQIRARNIPIR